MMLVVVKFQRFLRHIWRKGVMGIGKVGEREGHGVMSENGGRQCLTGTLIEGSNPLRHIEFALTGQSAIHAPARLRIISP
jgi:hypothetical protein